MSLIAFLVNIENFYTYFLQDENDTQEKFFSFCVSMIFLIATKLMMISHRHQIELLMKNNYFMNMKLQKYKTSNKDLLELLMPKFA